MSDESVQPAMIMIPGVIIRRLEALEVSGPHPGNEVSLGRRGQKEDDWILAVDEDDSLFLASIIAESLLASLCKASIYRLRSVIS